MYPSIQIGTFHLSTHLILNILAAVILGIAVTRRQKPRGIVLDVNASVNLVFYLTLGVLGGAYLALFIPYVVNYFFLGQPVPAQWWLAGQNWFGAVTGGSVAGLLYCKRYHYPIGKSFDHYAPFLPLTLAIVRIGCLLAGDSYGQVTDAWVAMRLPDVHGDWANRYPTQIVDGLLNLLLMFILLGFEHWVAHRGKPQHWPFEGFLFWLYVLLFCAQRMYFEFWRGDTPPLFGPFSWNHLYSLLGILAALAGIAYGLHRRNKPEPAQPPDAALP